MDRFAWITKSWKMVFDVDQTCEKNRAEMYKKNKLAIFGSNRIWRPIAKLKKWKPFINRRSTYDLWDPIHTVHVNHRNESEPMGQYYLLGWCGRVNWLIDLTYLPAETDIEIINDSRIYVDKCVIYSSNFVHLISNLPANGWPTALSVVNLLLRTRF